MNWVSGMAGKVVENWKMAGKVKGVAGKELQKSNKQTKVKIEEKQNN